MLNHFPFLTYAAEGRACFGKALDFNPAEKLLNANIIAIVLDHWEIIEPSEQENVRAPLRKAASLSAYDLLKSRQKSWTASWSCERSTTLGEGQVSDALGTGGDPDLGLLGGSGDEKVKGSGSAGRTDECSLGP
jgi:hypothetical protein